jgi:micrococcal nuclease
MKKLHAVMISSAVVLSVFFLYGETSTDKRGIEATVSKVIDGDTIQMANGDVVRLIGVDAPEKGQPYYDEVVDELRKIEGRSVRLEKDVTNKDRYGRYLRYVFLGDHFVNLELVRSGMVYAYIVNPDSSKKTEFIEAESVARSSGSGVWRRSDHSNCVVLDELHYNAKGDDSKNLEDEYFVLENVCSNMVEAVGWSVRNSFHGIDIPMFSIGPKSKIVISSGSGENSREKIFLKRQRPVWSNDGDSFYLKDGLGYIVTEKNYKNA